MGLFVFGGLSALGFSSWTVMSAKVLTVKIRALIIRIGFGGILYSSYNKEPPKPYSNY